MELVPVILAGGVGSRLWPLSREAHPKPFIKLPDNQSLIQKTYQRAMGLPNVKEIVTVTNRELFFHTKDEYEELPVVGKNSFILEPFGKNSAPAIALAAYYIQAAYGPNAIMLVLPADQLIANLVAFEYAVASAIELACDHKLVTFGIKANHPSAAYGYLQADGNTVLQFVEKPSADKAREYLAAGNYFWNAGMFCMSAATLLSEINLYCPDIYTQANICLQNAIITNNAMFKNNSMVTNNATLTINKSFSQIEIRATDFSAMRDISIDYALFEKASQVAVVPCDLGWSDVGSWLEFGQLYNKDHNNNHIVGETILEDVQNCIIHSSHKLTAGIHLNGLVIVDTDDALLIADQNNLQDVRKIVKTLKDRDHKVHKQFPTVHRPWGSYLVLQEGAGFKLKYISVKPKASLSLQSHKHRSEHWVVVSGTAQVINGDQELQLQHNESTYIPAGNIHRLTNTGTEPLILIEVQCGSYLEEDDIVRYEDIYGRIPSVAQS